ncbi:hypothetical protein MUK42_30479 [Musa troglodytarum]|uniref:Uncharacterized protein n=1 Tax=Musa troglodytarum TaxID=320322 RepID=A0A9E7FHK1_9LILI|nr:hypothetical protein MUK42_30479 [Musa troglodytarum]URD94356.1 hypothetical protein MUK42_30479 [Musa troglodytarum]
MGFTSMWLQSVANTIEMATKVQSKSYLPGYHSMQDIKEDAPSSWSSYYKDKKFSDHLYDTYVSRLTNGHLEHDKEMIKRMMLEHEAIFRKQVYELHRLYRRQKDLMTEIRTSGFYGSSIPAEASLSSSFSSQMRSECTQKVPQMSHLTVGNTSHGKTHFSGTGRSQFIVTREGSTQSDQIPLDNGVLRKDSKAPEHKPQKKRMFDLQLPADVYIDIEDTDGAGQMSTVESSHSASIFKNRNCSLHENDVKLTLGSAHTEEHQISNSPTQVGISACSQVDLNKPTTEICCESPANSASVQLFGLKSRSGRNHGYHPSTKSKTSFVERHDKQQTTSDLLYTDGHTKREWPVFVHEPEKNRSTLDYFAQVSTSSETLQVNTKKCHNFFTFDQNNPETLSRQGPTHNIHTCPRVPHLACSNPSLMSPSMASTITTPQADLISCASSFVSSWRKPVTSINNTPVAVRALPCFSGSSNFSNESLSSKIDVTCQKWQSSRNLAASLGTGVRVPHKNGFHHGLHLDCNSAPHTEVAFCKPYQIDDSNRDPHGHLPGDYVKCFQSSDLKVAINLNLNQAVPSGTEDRLTLGQETVIYVDDKMPGDPSWLRNKASSDESVNLKKHDYREYCQLTSSSNVASEIQKKEELEFSVCNLQEVASTSQFHNHGMQANFVSGYNGERLLGFPIHATVQQSSISVSIQEMEKHFTDNTKILKNDIIDLTCDAKAVNSQEKFHNSDSVTEMCGRNSGANLRKHINLNAEFSCMDDPIFLEISPQDELEVQSSNSIQTLAAKIASDIDFEAPISQVEMPTVSPHEYILSSKKDVFKEEVSSGGTLDRLAAENLVAMSLECSCHPDEINSHLPSLPRFDTLCWLADVSCNTEKREHLGDEGDDGTQSFDDDGLDLFEAMTLKLQETKMDQCWYRSEDLESKDGKEDKKNTGAASLLFTRTRRGRARKRRQRRDFQKDILPGLASLSRHEITEDLQTIGGMMKASGMHWQPGLARRNMGRNGTNTQTKGRRQLESPATATEEVRIGLHPPSQPSKSEIGVDGRSMIGWGRTTRRCRRQRCLPGDLSAPLT